MEYFELTFLAQYVESSQSQRRTNGLRYSFIRITSTLYIQHTYTHTHIRSLTSQDIYKPFFLLLPKSDKH